MAGAAQQLHRGLPVVVPASFAFEAVDGGGLGTLAMEVVHRFDDCPAVAGAHIADYAIDVEQHDGPGRRGEHGHQDWLSGTGIAFKLDAGCSGGLTAE